MDMEENETVQQPETDDAEAGQEEAGFQQNEDFKLIEVPEDKPAEDGAGDAQQKTDAPPREPRRQTTEENHAFRAERLREQRAAIDAAMAESVDSEIAGSGVINPYTKKPFQSLKEFREYGERVRKAKLAQKARQTGRSVEELEEEEANRSFISSLRRETERRRAAPPEAPESPGAFIARDVMDFIGKYPEFNDAAKLTELESNPTFRRFCGSRFGREPLVELYEDYRSVIGDAGSAALSKSSERRERSTGSGTGGGVVLKPSQRAALDKWNAEHPEMAMTAKEFLGR